MEEVSSLWGVGEGHLEEGLPWYHKESVPLILKLGHLLNTSFPLPSFNTYKVEEKTLFPVRKQSKGNH